MQKKIIPKPSEVEEKIVPAATTTTAVTVVTYEEKLKAVVRPGSVVTLLIFFMFIVLADGNLGSFHVQPGYYSLIEGVITSTVVTYFGMRGIEKTARIWRDKEIDYSQPTGGRPPTKRKFVDPRTIDENEMED